MTEQPTEKEVAETLGLAGSPGHRRRWLKWLGWLAAGLAVAALLWVWQSRSAQNGLQYRTEAARRGDLVITVSATGNLEPTNQVDVGSELSGIVDSVGVDYNDRVRAGQVLAELDTDKLRAQVLQSEAALAAAPAAGTLIELAGVTKVYGQGEATMHALRGIDVRIGAGEFVAVMGPSGSGKSTCMNLLGCLDTPSAGAYRFQGVEVGRLSRDQRALLRRHYLGFVFQGFNLLSRTSALENVELPLIYRAVPAAERRRQALRALEAVGLAGWARHTPGELSGGQQQRVAIARAIVTRPALLLADEPTGNLDSARSREIMELLQAFNRDLGITVVMVTHEPDMAAYARRVVQFLDGRVEADHQDGEAG